MDRYGELKRKLKNRERVFMPYIALTLSPFMMDALSDADCILLDKEHGLYGTEELVPLTMRCREKKIPTVIRVEDSQYHLIAKTIDLGADGIMLPRVETVEQIKTAVEAMHFAPIGRTGYGGWGLLREGESLDEFQSGRILMPQIESPKGLEAMPEMIRQYGQYIDAFVIGPNDYSIQMGVPRMHDHPTMVDAVQRVFDLCVSAGISCGCYAADAAHASRYAQMGANLFWLGDDASYMRSGWQMLKNSVE